MPIECPVDSVAGVRQARRSHEVKRLNLRQFGPLGSVSALSLGGGGIGSVWGDVAHDEAVATVREAVDAGITLLDLAPTYGRDEREPTAELVVGSAFGGRVPGELLVTSKVALDDPLEPDAIRETIRASVGASVARLGRHLDVLLLHSPVRPSAMPHVHGTIDLASVRDVVVPEFERLVAEGSIRSWGLTGVACPDELCELLEGDVRPAAVQCVVNALDSVGNLWPPGLPFAPDNQRVRAAAAAAGVGVMGIRAVAAGALTEGLNWAAPADDPALRDVRRAEGFRALARERGESAALLAHRYALSVPHVSTVVLGVKNRAELAECLAAEAAGPLTDAELREVQAA